MWPISPWVRRVSIAAFAVVVELTEAGTISREEWADHLGAVLKEAEARGEYDTGERYYDYWLTALERIIVEKNLADRDELKFEGESIRENDHHNREHQLAASP